MTSFPLITLKNTETFTVLWADTFQLINSEFENVQKLHKTTLNSRFYALQIKNSHQVIFSSYAEFWKEVSCMHFSRYSNLCHLKCLHSKMTEWT